MRTQAEYDQKQADYNAFLAELKSGDEVVVRVAGQLHKRYTVQLEDEPEHVAGRLLQNGRVVAKFNPKDGFLVGRQVRIERMTDAAMAEVQDAETCRWIIHNSVNDIMWLDPEARQKVRDLVRTLMNEKLEAATQGSKAS